MKKLALIVVALLGAVLLVGQIAPIPRADNPPVGSEVPAPEEVRAILRTSCYDCHSHETVWPWYSHVVPTKWLVRRHVVEGREHLNFSDWGSYTPERAAHKLEEVVEEVEEGAMPLKGYLRMHDGAALTAEKREILLRWAREAAAPPQGS